MAWTKTVWTSQQYRNNPDPNFTQDAIDRANQMAAEGKTDGVPLVRDVPATNEVEVQRTFTDLAAAQEWLDYVAPYSPVWAQKFEGSPPAYQ